MSGPEPLLAVRELTVTFRQRRQEPPLRAVDSVSFEIPEGKTVALVGESGSGKSTIGNAILGLVPISSGSVTLRGQQTGNATRVDRSFLSKHVQVIFQDPYGSLNPARTIGQILVEPLMVHRKMSRSDMKSAVADMLKRVGLEAGVAQRYPANFSGGQRQRIAVARAMIIAPDLVICDEPVSSLDLSVQAQILNLLSDLQRANGLSYLFISHDIAVVRHVADRVVVLYRGQVVEIGSVQEVSGSPRHPYTRALIAAAPVPDPVVQRSRGVARRQAVVEHEALATQSNREACAFAHRCPYVVDRCRREKPNLRIGSSGALVACHLEKQLPEVAVDVWPCP